MMPPSSLMIGAYLHWPTELFVRSRHVSMLANAGASGPGEEREGVVDQAKSACIGCLRAPAHPRVTERGAALSKHGRSTRVASLMVLVSLAMYGYNYSALGGRNTAESPKQYVSTTSV